MALPKEPKSMAEIHAIRRKIDAKTKGMSILQKLAWVSKRAKMLGKSYVDPMERFKKAS